MKLSHYGVDSTISINERKYLFSDFLKLEPTYSAPYGFHTRIYERGVRHIITDGRNSVRLPLFCQECDRLCNREGEFIVLLSRLEKEKQKTVLVKL